MKCREIAVLLTKTTDAVVPFKWIAVTSLMGFILASKLYTEIGERTEKLYLLFGKHRDTKAAMRIARVQTWSGDRYN